MKIKDEDALTKKTYENSLVVQGYTQEHGRHPKMPAVVKQFAEMLPGKRVIDIGCGPGQDSWHFSKLGFDVVGIDYSSEMIRTARKLETSENPPKFKQADMRSLEELFPENSFDGAWVCASLLHISREDVPKVLRGLRKIITSKGRIYISVKKGEGEEIKRENKYGSEMERYFVYWQKEPLQRLLEQEGFKIIGFSEEVTASGPSWLNFFLENKK